MVDERGRPLLHEHKGCGKDIDPVLVVLDAANPSPPRGVHVHPGPGKRVAVAEMPKTKARSRAV